MEKQKISKFDIEIVVALLEANIKSGKPTVKEVIGYLKRKYRLYYPEKIVDLNRKEQRY